jgi:hypothetical protein
MATVKHIDGNAPNDPTLQLTREGYDFRRGKVLPKAKTWGTPLDGMGKTHDADAAAKVLDEAER